MRDSTEKQARSSERESHPLAILARALRKGWVEHRKLHRRCRKRLTTKAVHRHRVQLRRLVSLLDLLRGLADAGDLRKARRMLRRRHRATRGLRDAQVGLKNVGRLPDGLTGADGFAEWLAARERRAARKADRTLKGLEQKRLPRLMDSLESGLLRSAGKDPVLRARRKLRRNVDRAFERFAVRDRSVAAEAPEAIHGARVALKRYAYMTGQTQPILTDRVEASAGSLREFMAAMGRIQDCEVLLAALGQYESKSKASQGAHRALRGELTRRRDSLIAGYLRARRTQGRLRPDA